MQHTENHHSALMERNCAAHNTKQEGPTTGLCTKNRLGETHISNSWPDNTDLLFRMLIAMERHRQFVTILVNLINYEHVTSSLFSVGFSCR